MFEDGLTLQDVLAADDAERGRIALPPEHATKVAVERIPGLFRASARRDTRYDYYIIVSLVCWCVSIEKSKKKHG